MRDPGRQIRMHLQTKHKNKMTKVAGIAMLCIMTAALTACGSTAQSKDATNSNVIEEVTVTPTESAATTDIETIEQTYEIGTELPDAKAFVAENSYSEVEYAQEYTFTEPGEYSVELTADGTKITANLQAVDTIAPVVEVKDLVAEPGSDILPEDFVESMTDATTVTAAFMTAPDLASEEVQTVILTFTDLGGNTTTKKASLHFGLDTTAPVLSGIYDRTVTVGKAVSYKDGVTAIDDFDGPVEIVVDSCLVNIRATGSYTVTYSATDSAGNTATQEAVFTFVESEYDSDEMDTLVDNVLDQILTDDMTQYEQAYAIYKYTYEHIAYIGVSFKADDLQTIYKGIVEGSGDCYSYAYISQVMMNKIGIPNIMVHRDSQPGETNHYWLIINVGDGWYYYDSCWHRGCSFDGKTFMFTEAQRIEWTNRTENGYYFRMDPEDYGVDVVQE